VSEATLLRGFEARVTKVDGVRTRYFVGGEGPPLVVVHGLGGAAVNFTLLAPLLARRHRVLIPDLPGHGKTEPLERADDLTAYADHVAALAELEGMFPAPLIGYSMGGVIALRLAVSRPKSVMGLALVAAAGIVSVSRRAEIWLAATGALRPAQVMTRFRGTFARRPRLRWLPFGLWGAVDPPALAPDLDHVRCPVLLLWGSRDRLVPLVDGFEYARRLRAPIRTLPAAGHLLVGEQPHACAEILMDFLDRIREVEELPLDAELVSQLGRERADA
jgi:pimeloyl-ACP methyl ester carboxylesterase